GKAEEELIVELSATTTTPPAGMRGHASRAAIVQGSPNAQARLARNSSGSREYGLSMTMPPSSALGCVFSTSMIRSPEHRVRSYRHRLTCGKFDMMRFSSDS